MTHQPSLHERRIKVDAANEVSHCAGKRLDSTLHACILRVLLFDWQRRATRMNMSLVHVKWLSLGREALADFSWDWRASLSVLKHKMNKLTGVRNVSHAACQQRLLLRRCWAGRREFELLLAAVEERGPGLQQQMHDLCISNSKSTARERHPGAEVTTFLVLVKLPWSNENDA